MHKRNSLEFSEQLIKGKIAELIFLQMFRNNTQFTVTPFGYENTFPEIAQYANIAEDKKVFETIRNAPDFALVSHNKKEVYLVEVKYRHNLDEKDLLKIATKIQNRWNSVELFIATPAGFYFDDCGNIIKNKGKIKLMNDRWIDEGIQQKYLNLLSKFISYSI